MRCILSSLMAFLCITSVYAGDMYVYSGITQESDSGETVLLINGQHYSINSDTVVYGSVVGGELGPIINTGQRIGYNIKQNNDESSYISEIWILE